MYINLKFFINPPMEATSETPEQRIGLVLCSNLGVFDVRPNPSHPLLLLSHPLPLNSTKIFGSGRLRLVQGRTLRFRVKSLMVMSLFFNYSASTPVKVYILFKDYIKSRTTSYGYTPNVLNTRQC